MIACLWPTWWPQCGEWAAATLKAQAPLWQRVIEKGEYTLTDWACYVNAMSEIVRCGF